MEEYELNLSAQELRLILDNDETFWPGYEEWLSEQVSYETEEV